MKKIKGFYGSVKNKAAVAGATALGFSISLPVFAIDTTAVESALTDAGVAVGVVGAAVLVVVVGAKAFKLIRAAL